MWKRIAQALAVKLFIGKQCAFPGFQRELVDFSSKGRLIVKYSYLTVHQVRFFWRRDIAKKTKIMRFARFG